MARKVRITRKEIMEPDAFITYTERASLFFAEHRGLLIGSLSGVILLALAVAGFSYNRSMNALKMETLLFEMEKAKKGEDKKAAIAEMTSKLGQVDEGPYRVRGALILADAQYDDGNFDAAMKLYKEVVDNSAPEGLAHHVALQGMAYSHLSRKEYDPAIERFRELIASDSEYPLFDIYAGLVRSYEGKGDAENAILTLREMQSKFQGHAQAGWVERRINKISPGA